MADCERNREACVSDNTGGDVSPPEEPPPQASSASVTVAASPGLASVVPASASAAAVSRETLTICGSCAATIHSLHDHVATRLPRSTNARYGGGLTPWSSRLRTTVRRNEEVDRSTGLS